MFGKSGFILRSLVVTFIVGSLVACTFEQTPEQQGLSTSAVDGTGNKKDTNNDPTLQGDDVDASADDDDDGIDGGPAGYDASADGGPSGWDASADGGPHKDGGGYDGGGYDGGGYDGGSWGNDGGSTDAGGGF